VRAEPKSLLSFDMPDTDLATWAPDGEFGILVTAFIGTSDSEASDAFEFTLCTPNWFADQMRGHLIKSGEHIMFMTRYDHAALVAYVNELIRTCDADTWEELGLQLCHLGQWEFEYRVSRRRHTPRAFDRRTF